MIADYPLTSFSSWLLDQYSFATRRQYVYYVRTLLREMDAAGTPMFDDDGVIATEADVYATLAQMPLNSAAMATSALAAYSRFLSVTAGVTIPMVARRARGKTPRNGHPPMEVGVAARIIAEGVSGMYLFTRTRFRALTWGGVHITPRDGTSARVGPVADMTAGKSFSWGPEYTPAWRVLYDYSVPRQSHLGNAAFVLCTPAGAQFPSWYLPRLLERADQWVATHQEEAAALPFMVPSLLGPLGVRADAPRPVVPLEEDIVFGSRADPNDPSEWDTPLTICRCAECKGTMYMTSMGTMCKNGHTETEDIPEAERIAAQRDHAEHPGPAPVIKPRPFSMFTRPQG